MSCRLKPVSTVSLTAEEQQDYGEWHRLGLANGHLGEIVAENRREGWLTVGLLANCSSLMGGLGGLFVKCLAPYLGVALRNGGWRSPSSGRRPS